LQKKFKRSKDTDINKDHFDNKNNVQKRELAIDNNTSYEVNGVIPAKVEANKNNHSINLNTINTNLFQKIFSYLNILSDVHPMMNYKNKRISNYYYKNIKHLKTP